jgi:hypothetical protein
VTGGFVGSSNIENCLFYRKVNICSPVVYSLSVFCNVQCLVCAFFTCDSFVPFNDRSSIPLALQANKSLLLKAMHQAEQSVAEARKQSGAGTLDDCFSTESKMNLYFKSEKLMLNLFVINSGKPN